MYQLSILSKLEQAESQTAFRGLTGLGDDHMDALNSAFSALWLIYLGPSKNKESCLELVQVTALQMIKYRVSSASAFLSVFLTYVPRNGVWMKHWARSVLPTSLIAP